MGWGRADCRWLKNQRLLIHFLKISVFTKKSKKFTCGMDRYKTKIKTKTGSRRWVQAYLRHIVGSVPDHRNKTSCNCLADGECCLQFVKNTSVRDSKAKRNKMRYACVFKRSLTQLRTLKDWLITEPLALSFRPHEGRQGISVESVWFIYLKRKSDLLISNS